MGMEESYFIDSFQLYAKTFDDWGEATNTVSTVPCYIYWGTKTVKDINGTDVVSKARIVCSDQDVSYDDKIKIGSVEYSIIQIDHKMAFNDPHLEILIQ
ncbi:MAG: hypothetical protein WC455_27755 [Dehalococcoidia bacterium]|jgi:hypothetical protein